MTPPTDDQADDVTAFLRPGKDEMNFAEFPIAMLTDRAPKGVKSIKFEDQVYDERRKKLITRRRIIEGSEEYGLPTATDDMVVLALIQLTKQKSDFIRRDVEFTRLELIRLLGWGDEGRNFERLKTSLLRIANVTYNYDNAWWDGRQKKWTTKAFHIIDTVEINDSRGSNGQSGLFPSRVVWGEAVFESFQSGFLRNIDFQLCMSLKHPLAVRMYRFLGKRFYQKPELIFELTEFAYNFMNLGRNYEGGTQIARKLRPAIAELEAVGFLEALGDAERYLKKGREWSIRFLQKGAVPCPAPPRDAAAEEAADARASRLAERGVTQATAAELVRAFPERIDRQVDYFDWLTAHKPTKIGEPGGYLADAIRKDYAAPKGYVSQADRERQAAAEQDKDRRAAAERRARQEQKAREKADEEAVAAYWVSLTPEQKAELDAASSALADPEALAIEAGPIRRIAQQLRREAYIRQLLADRRASARGQPGPPSPMLVGFEPAAEGQPRGKSGSRRKPD